MDFSVTKLIPIHKDCSAIRPVKQLLGLSSGGIHWVQTKTGSHADGDLRSWTWIPCELWSRSTHAKKL